MCYAGNKIFNSSSFRLTSLINEKAQFRRALIKYLKIYSFFSIDDITMLKNDS
jgi:hypothetical protein